MTYILPGVKNRCGLEPETQTHILEECTTLHDNPNIDTQVRLKDIFTDNLTQLKTTAKKLEKIEQHLDQWEKA